MTRYYVGYTYKEDDGSRGTGSEDLIIDGNDKLTEKDVLTMHKHLTKEVGVKGIIIMGMTEIAED